MEGGEKKIYSDEYIEHWGDVFVARDLYWRGILFETFLRHPRAILRAMDTHYLPLLPEQRDVQRRLVAEELEDDITTALAHEKPDARCSNGRFVEPLHHHAWPHAAARRVPA